MKTLPPALALAAALSACAAPATTDSAHPHKAAAMSSQPTATFASRYGFDQTVDALASAIRGKGMTVFAVIDHQDAAKQAGLQMQPAKVIIFGSPKAGTPLMVKDPLLALQLPLKVLVTEQDGQVTVAYTPAAELVKHSAVSEAEVAGTLAKAEILIRATVGQQQ